MRKIVRFTALLAILTLALGWLGSVHPLFDSIAVGREPTLIVGFICLVLLILFKDWRVGIVMCAVCLTNAITVYSARATGPDGLTLYQKNLGVRIFEPAPILADIRASKAQFVTLQEAISKKNLEIIDVLAGEYTSVHHCGFNRFGGIVVASIYPLIEGTQGCVGRRGAAYFQVQTDTGPLWLVSVHLLWPWPYEQPQEVEMILDRLDTLDGPMLIGGDFNMVAWAHVMKQFAKRTDTTLLRSNARTYKLADLFGVRIDHVFVPVGKARLDIDKRGKFGSDHFGLFVSPQK